MKITSSRNYEIEWLLQFIKFTFVGVLNTTLDWGVYLLLTYWFGNILGFKYFAKAFSYSVGIVNSFMLNRSWTFNSKAEFKGAFPTFFLISIVAVLINTLSMYVSVNILNFGELQSLFLATMAAMSWNFLISKFFVFRA
jgi:putative flippase GtrA